MTLGPALYMSKRLKNLKEMTQKSTLHILVKAGATKKLRPKVWTHSLQEYLYILTKNGLTLRYRAHAINQTDENFFKLEGKNL